MGGGGKFQFNNDCQQIIIIEKLLNTKCIYYQTTLIVNLLDSTF